MIVWRESTFSGRSRSRRWWADAFAIAVMVLLSGFPLLAGGDGAYRSTLHGSRERGPDRRPDQQRGSCTQCHNGHGGHVSSGNRKSRGLFGPNDNGLCFSCHNAPSNLAIFPSLGDWMLSSHAVSFRVVAPGRSSDDVNKCVNCHDPHGVKDREGLVPSLLAEREAELCLGCHDGSRGVDIQGQMLRGDVHGEYALGRHEATEDDDPAKFAAIPVNNRHVGCSDCHNPHIATQDVYPPEAPYASRTLAGVSRVEVVNGSVGVPPSFKWVGAGDPQPVREYEICFKCHSSWTKQLPGQPDLALLTNPSNPSFHPIQAVGKNVNIDFRAFVAPVSGDSMIKCTSCHAGDDREVNGPHASTNPYLLSGPSATGTTEQRMGQDDICFTCHAYEVYADPTAPETTLEASRFNVPNAAGHAFHVGARQITCWACHESHGSTRQPGLIATSGRFPGILTFTQTRTGGECTTSCHVRRSYTVNYPR